MSKENPKCFIIMPITTPGYHLTNYANDKDHFKHVLECLFIPAVENAGFTPIPPETKGSEVIHAEIIKKLATADLVLCDMSILNPNVFFEFGIRTALNKPVALVVDEKTEPNVPFDTSPINYISYDSSLANWLHEEQVKNLRMHIQESFKTSNNQNALWKYFGIAQTGEFKSTPTSQEDKLDFVIGLIKSLQTQISEDSRVHKVFVDRDSSGNLSSQQISSVAELLAVQQLNREKRDAQNKALQQAKRFVDEFNKEQPSKSIADLLAAQQLAQKTVDAQNKALEQAKRFVDEFNKENPSKCIADLLAAQQLAQKTVDAQNKALKQAKQVAEELNKEQPSKNKEKK